MLLIMVVPAHSAWLAHSLIDDVAGDFLNPRGSSRCHSQD